MHPATTLEIIETPWQWFKAFHSGWLTHYYQTGQVDMGRYVGPVNRQAPCGGGIDLGASRVLLVSAGGFHLRGQSPFNAANSPLGDYTVHLLPVDTPQEEMVHTPCEHDPLIAPADPGMLLPLGHLNDLVAAGEVGALAPEMVIFNGYQPDAIRVAKELLPAVLAAAERWAADAALLIPATALGTQTAGLVARGLEVRGVATVLLAWEPEWVQRVAPPRAAIVELGAEGAETVPDHSARMREIVAAALGLLEEDAPLEPVVLNLGG